MSKTVLNRLKEIESRIYTDAEVEKRHQEFLEYIQYLIDNPLTLLHFQ